MSVLVQLSEDGNMRASLILACSCLLSCAPAQSHQIDSVFPLVEETYRYLHENPETGLKEQIAHDRILEKLNALGGFEVKTISGLPTAVLAVYDTGRPGPTIALRSELDGRQLEKDALEPLEHSPRSKRDGYMHNCGHDAHAAMLLGAAAYVRSNSAAFRGKLVFVFQPAEETRGGADDIVAAGILAALGVQAMFAQHAAPNEPVGTYTITPGSALAGSATFTVTLSGRGSHAAAPFQGDDLAVTAARFIEELSYFPARRLDIANRPAVVSVAKLSTDAASTNMLPSKVVLEGTIRAFERIAQSEPNSVAGLLTKHIESLGAAYGIATALEIRPGAPPTRNDEYLYNDTLPQLRKQFGAALRTSLERGMFSEDFAYYTAAVPSLYFGLGIMKDGLGDKPVHTVDFTIHPDALKAGTALLVALAGVDLKSPEANDIGRPQQ